jgi:hypothetical protein
MNGPYNWKETNMIKAMNTKIAIGTNISLGNRKFGGRSLKGVKKRNLRRVKISTTRT